MASPVVQGTVLQGTVVQGTVVQAIGVQEGNENNAPVQAAVVGVQDIHMNQFGDNEGRQVPQGEAIPEGGPVAPVLQARSEFPLLNAVVTSKIVALVSVAIAAINLIFCALQLLYNRTDVFGSEDKSLQEGDVFSGDLSQGPVAKSWQNFCCLYWSCETCIWLVVFKSQLRVLAQDRSFVFQFCLTSIAVLDTWIFTMVLDTLMDGGKMILLSWNITGLMVFSPAIRLKRLLHKT